MIIDLSFVRQEFVDRIASAERLLDATHTAAPTGIEREARGLTIVLLFASYERLLHALTTELIDAASRLRVGNRRLKPGFQALALHHAATSVHDASRSRFYSKTLVRLVSVINEGRTTTLDSSVFPNDGSYMKASQIAVWCRVFDVAHPASTLREIWQNIDGVVADRNAIAHGTHGPEEVGRNRTEGEVRKLVDEWRVSWLRFIDDIQARASTRDFYRKGR